MAAPLDPTAVTMLLHRWTQGESKAIEQLLPLVYDELRAIARSYMRREREGHTLGATALVHETFLRLAGQTPDSWRDRKHFYGIAARLMRQVLVDYARHHGALKRDRSLISEAAGKSSEVMLPSQTDYAVLDECLGRLEQVDARKAEIIELRFFGGLTLQEIAETQGLSVSMVKKELTFAKIWLFRQIQLDAKPQDPTVTNN